MPRIAANLLAFILALICMSLVSAHMIEVAASKKECFFEDLHTNDQVGFFM